MGTGGGTARRWSGPSTAGELIECHEEEAPRVATTAGSRSSCQSTRPVQPMTHTQVRENRTSCNALSSTATIRRLMKQSYLYAQVSAARPPDGRHKAASTTRNEKTRGVAIFHQHGSRFKPKPKPLRPRQSSCLAIPSSSRVAPPAAATTAAAVLALPRARPRQGWTGLTASLRRLAPRVGERSRRRPPPKSQWLRREQDAGDELRLACA